MPEVGSASLAIIPSFKGFGRALEQGAGPGLSSAGTSGGVRFGDAAGKSAGRRFGSIFSTAAKASLVGVAAIGAGAFKLAKDSVGLASDLNESLNAVNVSYGKQAGAVKKLGREAAMSLGLSNTEFNALSVRFSAFSKTIAGGKGRKVVTTLDDLTTRASDFASVMNLEVNEAAELFQSGLAGETEPLRKYGIDLSAAAVEAYALSEGIVKNKDDLTEAAKVQARYGLLMKSTAKTQGDFANTSDSLANRQRILNARWDDARAKLGTALLPMMEDLSGWVLNKGLPAFERFSDWFVTTGIPAISDFASDMRPLAKSLLPAAGDALGIARDALKEAAPLAKKMVDAFNEMPDWAKAGTVGGLAGLYGLSKLRGKGKGGGLGGSLFSKSAPIPVFVVNEGFGDGPGGKKGFLKTAGKWAGRASKVAGPLAIAGAYIASPAEDKKRMADQTASGSLGIGGDIGGLAAEARAFDKLTDASNKAGDSADETRVKFDSLRQQLTNPFQVVFDDSNTTSVLSNILRIRQAAMLAEGNYDITFRYLTTGQIPAHGSTMAARASGGYVPGYTDRLLVGERGPEVLNLSGSASVTPNHQIRADSSSGSRSQRVVLDFGAGRTLSGWIQDEIADADAFAGTRGRMG